MTIIYEVKKEVRKMENWIQTVGTWAVGLIALAVGLFLIGRAVVDVRAALGGSTKKWGDAVIGVIVGVIGGLLGWWGASNIIGFFKTSGATVPHG